MAAYCTCKKDKKKVVDHLKGDIKGYKKEIKEDKELVKSLKRNSVKKKKPKGSRAAGPKAKVLKVKKKIVRKKK